MHAIWVFLTDFGDTAVTVPLAVVVTGFLLAAKERRLAIGWGLAILGVAGAVGGLKLGLSVCGYKLRDAGLLSPSGHTAMSIAVYGGLAVVVGNSLERRARGVLFAGAAIFTIGIALSRTIVGYHTPIDVAIGLVVGIAALGSIIAIAARYPARHLPLGWLVAGLLLVFALFHGMRWPAEQAIHRLAWWLDLLRPWCS